MRSKIQLYSTMEKLAGFIGWLTNDRWQVMSAETVDELYTEIYQLERSLANAPTRPTRVRTPPKPLEPITEQQKIMDMAG